MKIQFKEFLQQAAINRLNFLESKKREWIECPTQKEKNTMIAELIQLEPSHLAEPWIQDQVIKWLKDRENNFDYLEMAFLKKGKRTEVTEDQYNSRAKAFFLFNRIKKMNKKMGISFKRAVEKHFLDEHLVLPEEGSIEFSDGVNVEKFQKDVKARLQRYKRLSKIFYKKSLPYPYYGLDIVEMDEGTENHRYEIYIVGPIEIAKSKTLFGKTTISFPITKKTNQ